MCYFILTEFLFIIEKTILNADDDTDKVLYV